MTSLSGHLKGKYVQIRRPVYFCCLGNFLSSSVFHYPRVRLLGKKTSQYIQRWKGKKLTDSFGKRIKIYTVKLPPVSDRKKREDFVRGSLRESNHMGYAPRKSNTFTRGSNYRVLIGKQNVLFLPKWSQYGRGSPKKCREIY